MYAIVNISGKQFKAEKGSKLCVPKLSLEEGKKIVLDDVLMVHDGKSTNFGSPTYANSSDAADANGYGAFEYAPPSGYYALCTKNLGAYGG
jgi:large subunit ribosomal protein L21